MDDGDTQSKARTGNKPIPDPTALTTAALEHEVVVLRREMAAQRELLESKLEGMQRTGDATYRLAREVLDVRMADHKIHCEARLDAVQRETMASFAAVDAQTKLALTAQQDAVAKQERAVERTIEAMQSSLRTELESIKVSIATADGKLAETMGTLATRVERTEGQRLGATQLWATLAGALTLLLIVAGLVMAYTT